MTDILLELCGPVGMWTCKCCASPSLSMKINVFVF